MKKFVFTNILMLLCLFIIFQGGADASVIFTNEQPYYLTTNLAEFKVFNDFDNLTRTTIYYVAVYDSLNNLFSKTDPHPISPFATAIERLNVPTTSIFTAKIFTSTGQGTDILTDTLVCNPRINVQCTWITNLDNLKIKIDVKNFGGSGNWKYIIRLHNEIGTMIYKTSSIYSIDTLESTSVYSNIIYTENAYDVEIYCYINNQWILTDTFNHQYQDNGDIVTQQY
jgi:hypothetical protein